MAVTYPTNVKTDRMEAVVALIDAGTGAGKLEIGTAAMAATLVTFTLDDPSATVTNDVLTLAGVPLTQAATGDGTAAAARIRDSDNNDVVTGLTVGTSGTDIIIDNTSIATDQNVTLVSGTITHAT